VNLDQENRCLAPLQRRSSIRLYGTCGVRSFLTRNGGRNPARGKKIHGWSQVPKEIRVHGKYTWNNSRSTCLLLTWA
jgi:hypothetical protein